MNVGDLKGKILDEAVQNASKAVGGGPLVREMRIVGGRTWPD